MASALRGEGDPTKQPFTPTPYDKTLTGGGGPPATFEPNAPIGQRFQDYSAATYDPGNNWVTDLAMALAGVTAGFAGGGLAGALGGSGAAGGAATGGAEAGAGAGTIGSTAAGDIALTDPLVGLGDAAGGLAASDAAAAGLGSVGAVGTTPLASAGDIAGSSGMLDPLTVTAPSTAGGAGVSDLLGAGGPLLASLGASPGVMSDIGATLPSGQPQFLGASDTQPSLQPMSGDMMSQFGIDPGSISTDTSFDASLAADNPGYGPMDIAGPSTTDSMQNWLKNPRNLSTLASLGISGATALSHPSLPGAGQQAQSNATALTKGAIPVIQSGGTATPLWSSQKASIDATIDQQIKQQSQSLQQAAINSGMGNQNSGVVQQQIAEMTRQANVQRQDLYTQAQQQNVNNALSELAQGDQILAEIAAMQLQQDERAKQLAGQTAELALLLASGASMPRGGGP